MALTSITKDFIVKSGLIVGTTATIKGDATLQAGLAVTGISTLSNAVYAGNTLQVTNDTTLQQGLRVTGISTLTGATFLGDGLTVTNDALLNQGLHVVGISTLTSAVYAGSTLNVAGQFSVATNKFVVDTNGNTTIAGDTYTAGAAGFQGNISATGTVKITSTEAVANDGSAGALVVSGGAYVGKQLYVANTATFNKDVYITGALFVEGGQTIINSSVVTTGDKVVYVSTSSGSATAANGSGIAVGAVGAEYITFEYDGSLGNGGRANWVSSGGLIANVTASSTTTVAANAISSANGGIGANGDSFINGNLGVSGVVFGTTTQANNLNGGGQGQLVIQSANGQTTFIAPGTTGQTLTWDAANNTATWTTVGGSTSAVEYATHAEDIKVTEITDNTAYPLTFTDGATGFYGNIGISAAGLTFDPATGVLAVSGDVTVDGSSVITTSNVGSYAVTSLNSNSGSVTINSGSGISVDSTTTPGTITISNTGVISLTSGSNISITDNGNGDFTIANTYSSSDTLDDVVGRGSSTTRSIEVGGLKDTALTVSGGLVYNSDGAGTLADSSNLTFDGTNLAIGGSGGDITMTGGSITGVNGVTASGTVQGGYVNPTNLTTGRVTYYNGTSLVDSSNLTFDGTILTADQVHVSNTSASTSSVSANALYVSGGAGFDLGFFSNATSKVNGDLYVDGQIFGLTTATISQFIGNTGTFYGDTNGFQALYAGITGYSVTPSTVFQTAANINDYAQNNFQNINTGAKASTDWCATGGDGTDSTNFIDMGITSAAWDGTQSNSVGTAAGGNDGYLYVQGNTTPGQGNLIIGTVSSGSKVKVLVGAPGSSNIAATFDAKGTVADSGVGTLSVDGGASIAKNLYVGTTATIQGDLNVGGTIYMKGVGLDTISSTTGTFVNVTVTGTGPTLSGSQAGAISVDGGVKISKDLYVGTTATVAGSLFVNGSAVITNATIGGFANTTHITAGDAIGVASTTVGSTTTYTISNLGVQSISSGSGISVDVSTGTVTVSSTDTLADVTGRGATTTDTININSTTAGTQAGLYIRNNAQAAGTFDSISGTSAVTIDTFSKTDYTSAKYLVQIIDSGDIHTEEILVIQDGTNVYITEYGIITNAGELGVFDGAVSGSNVNITFKPTGATAMTIQVVRQSILTTAATHA